MSVRNGRFDTAGGITMRFLIEPVYCMTWIWTLHSAHNKLKSPIEEDNIWANYLHAFIGYIFWKSDYALLFCLSITFL